MRRNRWAETPENRARWNFKTRYGITPEAIDALLRRQDGCGICGAKEARRWTVDHDHRTGYVRGILCHRCNILLAGIEDDSFLERAQAYLRESVQRYRGAGSRPRTRGTQIPVDVREGRSVPASSQAPLPWGSDL